MTSMDALRQEHQHLRPRLTGLRTLADSIERPTVDELAHRLASTLAFLEDELLAHALAEDSVLYPAVAEAMGASQATATMSRDHLEIARLIAQLRHLANRFRQEATKRLRRDVRRVLYEIAAVVSLHLDKEEEIYLPLLEGSLTPEAAGELLAALEHATHAQSRAS